MSTNIPRLFLVAFCLAIDSSAVILVSRYFSRFSSISSDSLSFIIASLGFEDCFALPNRYIKMAFGKKCKMDRQTRHNLRNKARVYTITERDIRIKETWKWESALPQSLEYLD